MGHDDLAPVYASADVHVSCSQFETLGNTVLEAHACGTTVVLPKTQGFVDTVNHEVTSTWYLVFGGNLSEALLLLLCIELPKGCSSPWSVFFTWHSFFRGLKSRSNGVSILFSTRTSGGKQLRWAEVCLNGEQAQVSVTRLGVQDE